MSLRLCGAIRIASKFNQNITIMSKKVTCVNILDTSDFYYYCKRHGWTNGQSREDFDELTFFEGDPDMIKYKGQLGFFFFDENNRHCYYWLDVFGDEIDEVEHILELFCIGLGYADCDSVWNDCSPHEIQNWAAWNKMQNGIAYRGGSGYVYGISDTSKFIKTKDVA